MRRDIIQTIESEEEPVENHPLLHEESNETVEGPAAKRVCLEEKVSQPHVDVSVNSVQRDQSQTQNVRQTVNKDSTPPPFVHPSAADSASESDLSSTSHDSSSSQKLDDLDHFEISPKKVFDRCPIALSLDSRDTIWATYFRTATVALIRTKNYKACHSVLLEKGNWALGLRAQDVNVGDIIIQIPPATTEISLFALEPLSGIETLTVFLKLIKKIEHNYHFIAHKPEHDAKNSLGWGNERNTYQLIAALLDCYLRVQAPATPPCFGSQVFDHMLQSDPHADLPVIEKILKLLCDNCVSDKILKNVDALIADLRKDDQQY